MSRILIIGASSGIAQACARTWADRGDSLVLLARDADKLDAMGRDLLVRGAADVRQLCLDVRDRAALADELEQCFTGPEPIDVVLIAHGTLPDQERCEQNVAYALEQFDINATSTIALLALLGGHLERQGSGQLVYISSVAGDRGRPSNYLYGSAKAAVNTYCEGLRARLFKAGAGLLVVKPGFVATPMTADLDLPAALTVSPEVVARDIHRAIARRRDTLYTPWFWRPVMLLIRLLPQAVFKRLDL